MFSNLTVTETLMYIAQLRLPGTWSPHGPLCSARLVRGGLPLPLCGWSRHGSAPMSFALHPATCCAFVSVPVNWGQDGAGATNPCGAAA
jgi:hypothetical protein